MYTLHQFKLCPFSRKVRVQLTEKDLSFDLQEVNFWERPKELLKLNHAAQVPVLVDPEQNTIADSMSISEYLESKHIDSCNLIGKELLQSSEIRRLISWFDIKFFNEVTKYILNEKVVRFFKSGDAPCSSSIRAAKTNLDTHMKYISFLSKDCNWLNGDEFTLADISAATQISVIDYFGEIKWENYPQAKEWYALVKSRPSFRAILQDRIAGFVPPKHYSDPDF